MHSLSTEAEGALVVVYPNRPVISGTAAISLYAISLLLGGCAGPMGPVRPASPPPQPVTTFDGSYRTTIKSESSFGSPQENAWCDTPGQPVIAVSNGQFTYSVPHPNVPGEPTPVYLVNMAQDGSFYGETINGSVSGQVRGSSIRARIDGSACIYTITGTRI